MSAFILGIIFVVLFAILAVLFIGAYLLSKLLGGFSNLRRLFMQLTGWGRNEKAQGRRAKTSSGHDNFSQTANKAKKESREGAADAKMFDRNEGVYIDFEEVK